MLETRFFLPILILLGISCFIALISIIFKIHVIPTFILEVIVGMALGPILMKYFEGNGFTNIVDFLYVIGFSFIMFLSGFDGDLKIFKNIRKKMTFNIAKFAVVLFGLVFLASLIASIFFIKAYDKKILGIILMTITFSSTFAGVVAPLVHIESLGHTNWGKLIVNYSFLSELASVVLLTIYMLVTNKGGNYLSYLGFIGVFILLFYILKIRRGRRIEEGMVHFSTKLALVALAACVLLGESGGGEYVLGAFLLGFFLKTIGFSHDKLRTLEGIGYGMFIPLFFIILGMRVDVLYIIEKPELILTSILLLVAFVVVKLPFLILSKFYYQKTVYTSIALVTCTLVVAVAAEHLGVHYHIFSEDFGQALLLAGVLSTILGTVIFEINCFGPLRTIRTDEKRMIYEESHE